MSPVTEPIIKVLWQNGYVVQVNRATRVLWKRRAGRSKQLLRKYLDKAAAFRTRLVSSAS